MATKGTVKWYNLKKHFGYITDENGKDHFLHVSQIADGRTYIGFEDGDEVEFEPAESSKGPVARNVRLVVHDAKRAESDEPKAESNN